MDHTYIDENLVVDRYVMGRLSLEEAERFEEHYVHCPHCLDRLEEAERFRGAVREVAAEGAAHAPRHRPEEGARILPFPAWVLATPGRRGLIAAALLTALVLPPVLLHRQLQDTRAELARAQQPQTRTVLFPVGRERGGSSAAEPSHRIRLGSEPEWVVLSLDLGYPEHDAYRATVLREGEGGEEQVWSGDGLTPDSRGALVIGVPSSFLEAGDYRVRVEHGPPDADSRPDAVFTFRVIVEE